MKQQLFNYTSQVNVRINTISSMGNYTNDIDIQVADKRRQEIIEVLPVGTLAHKIITSTDRLSEKQIWVIVFELLKNETFCQKVAEFYEELYRDEKIKAAKSAAKVAANKTNSAIVLDFVKNNGKKLGEYYTFVKNNRNFSKEFYSKKFSMESANAFVMA
jgi:hypothetical protein